MPDGMLSVCPERDGSEATSPGESCRARVEGEVKSMRGWQRPGPDPGPPSRWKDVEGQAERLKAEDEVAEADRALPTAGNNTLEDAPTS
jgi:hypothetical protein